MTKEKPNSDSEPRVRGLRALRPAPLDAETLAIEAFTFIAQDEERAADFLALTGLTPDALRESLGTPGFSRGVLAHVMGDETLLLALAAHLGQDPAAIDAAARRLLGPDLG